MVNVKLLAILATVVAATACGMSTCAAAGMHERLPAEAFALAGATVGYDASRPYEVLPGGAIRYLDNKETNKKGKVSK